MTADTAPVYSVQDRRESGEWRTLAELRCPAQARRYADLLRNISDADI